MPKSCPVCLCEGVRLVHRRCRHGVCVDCLMAMLEVSIADSTTAGGSRHTLCPVCRDPLNVTLREDVGRSWTVKRVLARRGSTVLIQWDTGDLDVLYGRTGARIYRNMGIWTPEVITID